MIDKAHEQKHLMNWKQHFPTYSFDSQNRDIVLAEYHTSAASTDTEERIFNNATNVVLVVLATMGSLAVGTLPKLFESLSESLGTFEIICCLVLLVCSFSFICLRYFSAKQKTIVIGQRKTIVLRRMLGLDYGRLQLVLPNKRVEGANEPFSLPIFSGWLSESSYPFWLLSIFSSVLIFFLLTQLKIEPYNLSTFLDINISKNIPHIATFMWATALAALYRFSLFDYHEDFQLWRIKLYAKIIRARLVPNIEYVFYRAKLSWYETERVQVEISNLEKILVFIEDKRFYKHSGIDYRALTRALLGLFNIRRRSGGSTITQQVVRSLFISDYSKTIRRKFLEILLAAWFESTANKEEIIKIYLSCVRYEKNVLGITEAMRHFFGKVLMQPTKAEAFFLIERISNIHSKILTKKIDHTLSQAIHAKLLDRNDAKAIVEIYEKMITQKKIHGSKDFEKLTAKYKTVADN